MRGCKNQARVGILLLISVLILPACAQHRGGGGHFGGSSFGEMHMGWHSGWHSAAMPRPSLGGAGRGEHLPQWLQRHQNMSLAEQQRALTHEPGFNRLNAEQQQRVLDQLHRLDRLPPAERQRILARNEAFERLSPERKQQVRAAVQALRQMPPGESKQLRAAFRLLRQMPPGERKKILNSSQMKAVYDGRERHILGNLLSVEPYEPAIPAGP